MDDDSSVLLARVAERAERYDEMADFMKERVDKGMPLNAEERDMFSAAFKGALTGRRHAVRVAVSIEASEAEQGNAERAALASGYKTKVEAELQGVCEKALRLLEALAPAAQSGEPKTFYLKMQGDYYRYLAEFASGESRMRAADNARTAYSGGSAEASALPTTSPVRLGLALNFSVFQHEVLGDTQSAIATAQGALSCAAADISSGNVQEDNKSDAYLTMQLLQDNLSLWQPEAQ